MPKRKKKSSSLSSWGVGSPEAREVTGMLKGSNCPLVAITFVGPALLGKVHYPRSVGFIVERFPKGLRLVVTCKHALEHFSTPAYRSLIAFKNPRPTMLSCIGEPIKDPTVENDVAFLVVRDPLNASTKPFSLCPEELPFVDGQTLYSAQNRCEPLRSYYDLATVAQQVHRRRQVPFCKLSRLETHLVDPDDTEQQDKLLQDGWIPHRLLTMVSRPGYSGSPIWDNQLRLHGMDIRGTAPKEGVPSQIGDVAVYLPVSMLYAARQRVDAIIQERIS